MQITFSPSEVRLIKELAEVTEAKNELAMSTDRTPASAGKLIRLRARHQQLSHEILSIVQGEASKQRVVRTRRYG